MGDGTNFPVPGKSDGLFCSVYEFEGEKIKRLHIYFDPDYTGTDTDRHYW